MKKLFLIIIILLQAYTNTLVSSLNVEQSTLQTNPETVRPGSALSSQVIETYPETVRPECFCVSKNVSKDRFQEKSRELIKVGLCITATNRYIKFVKPLIESARKFFLKDQNITYFVFTDNLFEHEHDNIKIIYLKHKPWPLSTMQRFEAYYQSKKLLDDMDYIFACDSDMLFFDNVSEEILQERVCVTHPLFWNNNEEAKNQFEDNPMSNAFVKREERKHYFAGGLYGGTKDEFLKLTQTCSENIRKDLEKNYIAIWHDESHLNKYFTDNTPTLILEPGYCYPDNYYKWIKNFPFNKVLVALDKGHNDIRYS